MSVDQPVAVILGAGMGGRGVAAALAGSAHLVIVDRDLELAEVVVARTVAAGGTAEAVSVNLTDLDAVVGFRDDLLARLNRVDAVVHLVGGWRGSKTVDDKAIEDWNALIGGIVTTLQTTSVAFRDALMAAPAGRFIMISSTGVERPTAGNAGYASTKAAAETWVKALGSSFKQSPARAIIVAVMALLNDEMRAGNPEKSFQGFTDTRDLGHTVADLLSDDSVDNGARVLAPTVQP